MRVVPIQDLHDPLVAPYRDLKDTELRRQLGLFMTEGRPSVRRLVEDSLYRTHSLFVTPTARDALGATLDALPDDTPLYLADQMLLDQVVGFSMHRGCLAAGERCNPPPVEQILAAAGEPSCVLLLERMSNPDNVGGIFRNAMAFGVGGVVLCPRSVDPLYRKAIRVSTGATLSVPFARAEVAAATQTLRAAGYRTLALDTDPAAMALDGLCERELTGQRVAILVGTEGDGLSAEALEQADLRVRIPMAAGVDSLNAATATGIALHRLCQRGLR